MTGAGADVRGTGASPRAAGAGAAAHRRRAVLGSVVLGGLALVTATTVWVTATTASPVDPDVAVTVTGADAAPGTAAGALVVLAAGAALSLGGRWGRRLAAVAVVLGGALVVVSAVGVLLDPAAPAVSAAQGAVGVGVLAGPAAATPAPWLAALCGAGAVALGAHTTATAGRWGAGSARHEVGAGAGAGTAAAGHGGRRPADGGQPTGGRPADDPRGSAPVDDQATWDALTRGEDPT